MWNKFKHLFCHVWGQWQDTMVVNMKYGLIIGEAYPGQKRYCVVCNRSELK